jgi:Acetyltransferases, including N-acetylases of ribosomal proteins
MYLKNDDLVIRQTTSEDIEILCNWWSDGKVMTHAGFPNGVHTDVNVLMKRIENGSDADRILIIEIGDKRVGEMSYRTNDCVSEIGIKICDFSYQEKGYGTKALNMLIRYLFNEIKVNKVILDTNLNNARAQHVYEKIGFRKLGVHIDSWTNQLGVLQSFVDYEMMKEDFLELKSSL